MVLTLHQLDLFPKAYADTSKNSALVPGTNYGLVPLNEDGSISVRLSASEEVDVNIIGVNTSDMLDVNIEEIGGRYLSRGGPIPVEME